MRSKKQTPTHSFFPNSNNDTTEITPNSNKSNKIKSALNPKKVEGKVECGDIGLVNKTQKEKVSKFEVRRKKNQEAAQKSRDRKRTELINLKSENEALKQSNLDLNYENRILMQENGALKFQVEQLIREIAELNKSRISNSLQVQNNRIDILDKENNMLCMDDVGIEYSDSNLLFYSPIKGTKSASSEKMDADGYFSWIQ